MSPVQPDPKRKDKKVLVFSKKSTKADASNIIEPLIKAETSNNKAETSNNKAETSNIKAETSNIKAETSSKDDQKNDNVESPAENPNPLKRKRGRPSLGDVEQE